MRREQRSTPLLTLEPVEREPAERVGVDALVVDLVDVLVEELVNVHGRVD